MKPLDEEAQQIDPRQDFWRFHEENRSALLPNEKGRILMVEELAVNRSIMQVLDHQKNFFLHLLDTVQFGAMTSTDFDRAKKAQEMYEGIIKPALINVISRI